MKFDTIDPITEKQVLEAYFADYPNGNQPSDITIFPVVPGYPSTYAILRDVNGVIAIYMVEEHNKEVFEMDAGFLDGDTLDVFAEEIINWCSCK